MVGVGIFMRMKACFKAGISPLRPANKLTKKNARVVETVKRFCKRAIETGGSTLRDFVNSDGKAATFSRSIRSIAVTMSPGPMWRADFLKKLWGSVEHFIVQIARNSFRRLKCQRPSENNEHNTEEILCLNKKAPFFKRLGRLCRLAAWLFRTGRDCVPSMATMQRNAITVVVLGKGALDAWISN